MDFSTRSTHQYQPEQHSHSSFEYPAHSTMSQIHHLLHADQHGQQQHQNQQNPPGLLHQSSQYYLDPTLYFDPTNFSQIPQNNTYAQYPTSSSLAQPGPKRKTRLRAARACIPCRSRHMKCDSIEPTCTRCQSESKTCEYARSRRGGPGRILLEDQQALPEPTTKTWNRDNDAGMYSTMSARSLDTSGSPNQEIEDETLTGEKLIAKYYTNFQTSQPFVLPKWNLHRRMQNKPKSVKHLLPILELIGSIYLPHISSEPYVEAAEAALAFSESPLELPRTGFTVQAFMLLSMARQCSNDYDAGHRYLKCAVDVALSINMHRRSFAVDNGEGDVVLEECWRRTWWMVFILDANYAGMLSMETHRLKGIVEEVYLPCEDADYESGQIPSTRRTIQEYDNREFLPTGIETVFSSLTYKIDSARIFSLNLAFCSIKSTKAKSAEASLAAGDARYVNWFLYLPRCKQKMIKEDGRMDESMFSALLIINSQKLLFHRPYSHLIYHPIEPDAKHATSSSSSINPAFHTAICMDALTSTINLFALPFPNLKFTPHMAWALSLPLLAQASACKHILKPGSEEYAASRDRIKLGLGAMRASMGCWFSACKGVEEIMEVARLSLAVGGERSISVSVSGSTDDDGSDGSSVYGVMDDM